MNFDQALEVKLTATDLIPAHHPHLGAARFAFLFTEDTITSRGRDVWAKTQTASALLDFFAEADFVIVVSSPIWARLTEAQRVALVDEELSRCAGKADKDGVMHWSIRAPDVEAFTAVIARRGLWRQSIREFAQTVRRWEQQTLPLGAPVVEEPPAAAPPMEPPSETVAEADNGQPGHGAGVPTPAAGAVAA